jgi:hypothetical protein
MLLFGLYSFSWSHLRQPFDFGQELLEVLKVWKSAMHINAFFQPQEAAVVVRRQSGDSQFMHEFFKGSK